MDKLIKQSYLRGIPISSGIAIGKLHSLHIVEDDIPEYSIGPDEVISEVVRYRNAIDSVKVQISSLQNELTKENDAESLSILDAHLQILDDPLIDIEIIADIRQKKKNAEYLFNDAVQKWQKKFHELGNSFFRERVKDLQDVARRVLRVLRGKERRIIANIPKNAIVFSKELSPSEVAEASLLSVEGFLTQNAGMASHTAIMSQAKKIPLVSGIEACDIEAFTGQTVIVDGHTGDVYIDPEPDILAKYVRYSFGLLPLKAADGGVLPSVTYDGYAVRLSANMEMLHDLHDFHNHGASGVGLFRSEYLFMSQDRFPSEEEQFLIYKEIVESMKGLPVVMRAFDIGGDKYLLGQQVPQENNPFLGCRAIRFLLREKHIFKSQLKAIVRASAFGDVSILFPMISSLAELLEAKEIVKEAQKEINCTKKIRIGCMIEVPSAAIIADLLAKECDFLSIGTNDLVQYSLAVDRGNCLLSSLYTPAHPSVIRLIKFVVSEANNQGIPVSVCGEIAADPRFTPLLLGLGVHELSVALHRISDVRAAIRATSIVRATALAEKALHLSSAEAIDELLFQEQETKISYC